MNYYPIQKFIKDSKELQSFLDKHSELSMIIDVNNHYKKILLLSCASFYEMQIISLLKKFFDSNSHDPRIVSFVTKKALDRQYHTLFDWDKKNINRFLGFFGEEFKNNVSKKIKEDTELTLQMESFIQIGAERNRMVHENFLECLLDKTIEEIETLHNQASKFIEYLEKIIA